MLSKLSDSNCTRCHGDLKNHSIALSGYETNITRFDRDHPPFNLGPIGKRKTLSTDGDPGKLRFNHKAHLTPGIRYSDKDAEGWRLANIKDESLRERYRKQQPADKRKDDDLVELTCASCHQLDASDAPKPGPGHNVPPRMGGEYVLAANYDQHCKACHPLTFNPGLPGTEIPHHLQPEDVRRFLWGVFARQEAKAFETKTKTDRPLPGLNIPREEKEAVERIKRNVGGAESFLFQEDLGKAIQFVFKGKTTCGLCHSYEGKPGDAIPSRIVPTNVTPLWYPHAMFNHRAHRAAKCQECHQGALESTSSANILIPGIENCRTCHSASTMVDGKSAAECGTTAWHATATIRATCPKRASGRSGEVCRNRERCRSFWRASCPWSSERMTYSRYTFISGLALLSLSTPALVTRFLGSQSH